MRSKLCLLAKSWIAVIQHLMFGQLQRISECFCPLTQKRKVKPETDFRRVVFPADMDEVFLAWWRRQKLFNGLIVNFTHRDFKRAGHQFGSNMIFGRDYCLRRILLLRKTACFWRPNYSFFTRFLPDRKDREIAKNTLRFRHCILIINVM